ncbi:MAG: amylo-alpha-1,6-glucosidase [Candidatus Aminicenantes bacterium]
MEKLKRVLISFIFFSISLPPAKAQEGLVPAFNMEPNPLALERLAQPGTPFDKVGRKFAILGQESGSFEAWAYPLKLFRNFEFSFFTGSSTRPIRAEDIVRHISVTPEATTLTYTYPSFTVKAIYITPVEEPGAIILLKVDSTEPLTIVCGFLPVLQPMWPAGLGGQYAFWLDKLKAYIISEPTGKNHGMVGSPAATGISTTPAHMLSGTPHEFRIDIPNPEKVLHTYIPIFMSGGKGPREEIIKAYRKLRDDPEKFYRENVSHYKRLSQSTLRVQTPEEKLNLAFEWAKVAYDNLVVENPDLGKGLVAGLGASGTSGRPGFGWFFGGDSFINCFSLLSCGAFSTVQEALAFNQKWQREDGKMAHELSQGAAYIDWWNDYHYGYIHADTTPFYIAAMHDYFRMSGDKRFIIESWDSLKRAYDWCLSTDANRDGLMDNRKAGLGALEYGALTGMETDVYLAAVWTQAARAMKHLGRAAEDKEYEEKAAQDYEKAKRVLDQRFWDEEKQFYVYAFNTKGETVKEISPWSAPALMWDLGTPRRTLLTFEKLNSSVLTTDWGVRSLSSKSHYYEPLGYNYGAVWPFLTSWVSTAQFKHHLHLQGYSSLMATAQHTFDYALGCIAEVFSGSHYFWPQETVAHQGFSSAGVVLPFVRGLLGLEGDALAKTVTFSPHFPADWQEVCVDNYKIGNDSFSFHYKRTKNKIAVSVQASSAPGYKLRFSPALGTGSKIQSLRVDEEPLAFKVHNKGQVVLPEADIPLSGRPLIIEMEFVPTVEILPPAVKTKPGERNKGLKIISIQKQGSLLKVRVEGLADQLYELRVANEELIDKVEGAELKGSKLKIHMPEGKPGTFLPHPIMIHVKKIDSPITAASGSS